MLSGQRDLAVVLAIFLFVAFALHLGSAAAGYSFYRDSHLGTALEYARGSIDLLRPVIVGFNANGAPTPLELPLWQAAAGLAMKLFGDWFGWANLVTLCFYLAGLWPFFKIAKRVSGESRVAWWATVLFASQPLVVVYSGNAGSDMFSLTLVAWFVFFGIGALDFAKWSWWVAAAVGGALCAVSKLPFFLTAALALFFLLLVEHRGDMRRWIGLGCVGAFSAVVFLLWTRYADRCLAAGEFLYIDLRVSKNPYMAEWYFGTLDERLDPMRYAKAGWRFLNTMAGSFALVALPLTGVFSRGGVFARLWLSAAIITTLIFFNLVTIHRHYYLIYSMGVALAAGQGAFLIERLWRDAAAGPWLRRGFAPLMCILLGLSLCQGLLGMEVVTNYDPYDREVVATIKEHTAPEDKLLVYGGGFGGKELFLSGRDGLSLNGLDAIREPASLDRLRELGYDKLVLISESPLLHASQVINPGGQGRKRETHHGVHFPEKSAWREVFSSEDVLVLELPR